MWLRPVIATVAPPLCSARAMCLPSPRLAPVTRAIFPERFMSFIISTQERRVESYQFNQSDGKPSGTNAPPRTDRLPVSKASCTERPGELYRLALGELYRTGRELYKSTRINVLNRMLELEHSRSERIHN